MTSPTNTFSELAVKNRSFAIQSVNNLIGVDHTKSAKNEKKGGNKHDELHRQRINALLYKFESNVDGKVLHGR